MPHADLLRESPSQTAGPYVHIGCAPNFCGLNGVYPTDLGAGALRGPKTRGEAITVAGCVYDGVGAPVRDALIEIWQADADGRYPHSDPRGPADPHFAGFGRAPTCPDSGAFAFETIKPGRAPFPDGRLMAPHITFWIVARGINIGLHTRLYFADEAEANAEDPWLTRIEHQNRLPTLVAELVQPGRYRFDIHLQGPKETIFFDV